MSDTFLFDAHLDLALNAREWNRDLTRPISEIRDAEKGMDDKPGRGRGTVSFPELRSGRFKMVVATQIATVKTTQSSGAIKSWSTQEQARAATQEQLAWYKAMEEAGELTAITSRDELERHIARTGADLPIGYLLSLEGADSLVTLGHLERAYGYGLRALGPAHYGPNIYAQGTGTTGGFPPRGRELLGEMDRLGMILDMTHLSDECFWEAIDSYAGPIWASHHNCRALVPHQRQLDDDQIRALVERGAVIGVALDAWMLAPCWERGKTTPESAGATLQTVVNHIDHICQIAGDAKHIGLGSDLDGGFGKEQTPTDVDTIGDLARLPGLLLERGYAEEDAQNFASGNFLRFLRENL